MSQIDNRGRLDTEPFSFRVSKEGKVFISWQGRQVTILSGKEAEKFTQRMETADEKGRQLIMAKATGNFKHGNEKLAKIKKKPDVKSGSAKTKGFYAPT